MTSGPRQMPFEEYAALKAVNWSTLRFLRSSPLHYRHRCEEPLPDTRALAKGRATHVAILEPERWKREFVLFDGRRSGKRWDAFAEEHANRIILSPDEHAACEAMRDAVLRNRIAARYLRGMPEAVITWRHAETGLPCKARIDLLDEVVLDLKTTSTVDARLFTTTSARMGYHCQLSFYVDGVEAVTGARKRAVLIAVETAPPHDVGVFTLDEDVLYAGAEEYQKLLRRVVECHGAKSWPGRYSEEQPLQLPSWVFTDEEGE